MTGILYCEHGGPSEIRYTLLFSTAQRHLCLGDYRVTSTSICNAFGKSRGWVGTVRWFGCEYRRCHWSVLLFHRIQLLNRSWSAIPVKRVIVEFTHYGSFNWETYFHKCTATFRTHCSTWRVLLCSECSQCLATHDCHKISNFKLTLGWKIPKLTANIWETRKFVLCK
jgi:hypothetical protein